MRLNLGAHCHIHSVTWSTVPLRLRAGGLEAVARSDKLVVAVRPLGGGFLICGPGGWVAVPSGGTWHGVIVKVCFTCSRAPPTTMLAPRSSSLQSTMHLNHGIPLFLMASTAQVWLELATPMTASERDMLNSALKSWFIIGKLGGYNSQNMQVGPGACLASLSGAHCCLHPPRCRLTQLPPKAAEVNHSFFQNMPFSSSHSQRNGLGLLQKPCNRVGMQFNLYATLAANL